MKGTSATDHLAFNPLLLVVTIFVWFWSSNLCYNPVSFQFDVSILFFDLVVQNVCQEFRFPPLFDHFGKFFLQEICFCSFDLDHLVRPLVIFDNCAKISDYFLYMKSLRFVINILPAAAWLRPTMARVARPWSPILLALGPPIQGPSNHKLLF